VVAEDEAGPQALCLIDGGQPAPALFLMGEDAGVAALLNTAVDPHDHVYLTLRPEHAQLAESCYALRDVRNMWRMVVTRATFRPLAANVVRLRPADLAAVNELYSWGGPDFFTASHLAQGVYYAVVDGGRLIAAAGTHIVAPQFGVGAVGNVYTAPEHRNQGHATACTSAVVAALLDMGCRDVVLNVHQDNEPALRAYFRLGFHIHCPFIEASGQRKSRLQRLIRRPGAAAGAA